MKLFGTRWKLSGISGLLFVTLSLIASGMNEMPPAYDQKAGDLSGWFVENGNRFLFGHFLAGIAFLIFYFPFYAGFCEVLKRAEGNPAIWTRVTWAGSIMSPAAGTIAGASIMGIALQDGNSSADVIRFALAANFYAYTVAGTYGGIAMIGAAIVILNTGVFKPWLGWMALFVGSAAILSTATLIENDSQGIFAAINGFAWMAYFLWIALMSIALMRLPRISSIQQGEN